MFNSWYFLLILLTFLSWLDGPLVDRGTLRHHTLETPDTVTKICAKLKRYSLWERGIHNFFMAIFQWSKPDIIKLEKARANKMDSISLLTIQDIWICKNENVMFDFKIGKFWNFNVKLNLNKYFWEGPKIDVKHYPNSIVTRKLLSIFDIRHQNFDIGRQNGLKWSFSAIIRLFLWNF